MKKAISMILAVVMVFAVTTTALAASIDVPIPKAKKIDDFGEGTINYTSADVIAEGYAGAAQPVSFAKSGVVVVGVGLSASTAASNVSFGLYTDPALQNAVDGSYGYLYGGSTSDVRYYGVKAEKTYYVGAKSRLPYQGEFEVNLATACTYADGADRTLSNKKNVIVGVNKSGQTNRFKIKAKETGYITVNFKSFNGKVTLQDSKKKSISNALSINSNSTYAGAAAKRAVFGVEKGKTYYIKVEAGMSKNAYQIGYKETKVSDKSGAKKEKALSMKSKKKYTGLAIAGKSTTDWYKFKLTKKQVVNWECYMDGCDNMTITICNSKGKKISSQKIYRSSGFGKTLKIYSTVNGKKGKWTKGTYYIKITTSSKKSSGYYTLKWK